MDRVDIYNLINVERDRQDKKWGSLESRSHSHMYWMTVLVEEIGEAAKAIWEVVSFRTKAQAPIRTELIQCAAVIVAWLEDRFDD